jgi:hypothetical protein
MLDAGYNRPGHHMRSERVRRSKEAAPTEPRAPPRAPSRAGPRTLLLQVIRQGTMARDSALVRQSSRSRSGSGALRARAAPRALHCRSVVGWLGGGRCAGAPRDPDLPIGELTEHDQEFLAGRTVRCGDACECADGSRSLASWTRAASLPHAPRQGEPTSSSPEDAQFECVPFAGLGESCEGFTLPWSFEQCDPSLVCDNRQFIADAPGICHGVTRGNEQACILVDFVGVLPCFVTCFLDAAPSTSLGTLHHSEVA